MTYSAISVHSIFNESEDLRHLKDSQRQFRYLLTVSTLECMIVVMSLTHDRSPSDQPPTNFHAVLRPGRTHKQQHGTDNYYDQLESIHLSPTKDVCSKTETYLTNHGTCECRAHHGGFD